MELPWPEEDGDEEVLPELPLFWVGRVGSSMGALAGTIVYRDETVMTHAHAAIDAASIAKLIGRQG